jgi:hypothetical protein
MKFIFTKHLDKTPDILRLRFGEEFLLIAIIYDIQGQLLLNF